MHTYTLLQEGITYCRGSSGKPPVMNTGPQDHESDGTCANANYDQCAERVRESARATPH